MTCRKSMSLKYKELVDSSGGRQGEKRVTPRNKGMSNDVYENKGQKILPVESLTMCMKTNKL
jgi:hypothetical protein